MLPGGAQELALHLRSLGTQLSEPRGDHHDRRNASACCVLHGFEHPQRGYGDDRDVDVSGHVRQMGHGSHAVDRGELGVHDVHVTSEAALED